MVSEMLSAVMPGAHEEALSFARRIVESLIARKDEHFVHLRRPILGFEVHDTGKGWQLNVISGLL